jgi:hypothetical protein
MSNVDNYTEQGGNKTVIDGEIDVTGTMKKGGTEITATADELNQNDVSANGAALKTKVINMTASDFADNSEVDTGWDLPAKAIVKNVFLDVNTKEDTATTKTVDVGTDGSGSDDPNGFLVGASVATAGLVAGDVDMTNVDGASTTLGALLVDTNTTNDTAMPVNDITSGGESITVTAGDASGFDEADFDIIIEYIEVA